MRLLKLSFLFCICATFGCVETETSNLGKSDAYLQSECDELPEGYDSCEVIEDHPDSPLQTLAEAEGWREISLSEDGSHTVAFDAEKVNGGLLLMEEKQGHYPSVEAFYERLSFLLEADIGLEKGQVQSGTISQSGDTLKLDGDPANPAFGQSSTTDLLFDALSDENGQIWVDGELVTAEVPFAGAVNYIVDEVGEYSHISPQALILKSYDGREEVTFNAFSTNWWVYKSIGSELKNYKRDGKSSVTIYDPVFGLWPRWRTVKAKPGSMKIRNDYYHNSHHVPSPGDLLFTRTADRTNVASLTLKEWWVGGGICVNNFGNTGPCGGADTGPVNTVCAYGRAGGMTGRTGTSASCHGVN